MFDIKEYYREGSAPRQGGAMSTAISEIEEDLSFEIDRIIRNRFDNLYLKDLYRRAGSSIDIIYPRIAYPSSKALVRGPDQVRNLLSLYPHKSDLENVAKIVLRPRHVEFGDIELMALYMRQRRILVFYLHYPHSYEIENRSFGEYSELLPSDCCGAVFGAAGAPKGPGDSPRRIPPLWYILSLISHSPEGVDKFFIKRNPLEAREISSRLNEISFYYSRHGY